eukprot:scaffold754_cov209-Alexandrium_tamarense.AAC.1
MVNGLVGWLDKLALILFCASASGYPTPPVSALLRELPQYRIWDRRWLVPNLAGMGKASVPNASYIPTLSNHSPLPSLIIHYLVGIAA